MAAFRELASTFARQILYNSGAKLQGRQAIGTADRLTEVIPYLVEIDPTIERLVVPWISTPSGR
ncbi:MAG: hypothetical protein AB7I37_03005 [Pirellulales bacterium]